MAARRQSFSAQTITHQHLMHATLQRVPFTAAGWIYEHKLDGFRALARKTGRQVELLSRTGRSLAVAFPEIVAALTALPTDAVLDCELVVVDQRGHPVWAGMRRRAMISRPSWAIDAAKSEPATLCTFDLLACDGRDVRDLPLVERKARLADAIAGVPGVQLVGHLEAHGEALFSQVIELGLEGIVAKRADSPYRAGRQPTWLKTKNQDYARREALRFRSH